MRTRSTLAATAIVALSLAACSTAEATSPDPTPDAPVEEVAEDPAEAGGPVVLDAGGAVALLAERPELEVIDVRTPAEFAEGRLEEAQLIDIQDPGFQASLEALDRDEPYLVYCRSGNRSAAAVSVMHDLGFTEVYDAGGLADLAAAGAAVVQ